MASFAIIRPGKRVLADLLSLNSEVMSLLLFLRSFSLCHKLVVCDYGIFGHTYIFFQDRGYDLKLKGQV